MSAINIHLSHKQLRYNTVQYRKISRAPDANRNELTPRDMASGQCWDIRSLPSVTVKTLHRRPPESSTANFQIHIPLATNWYVAAELASLQPHLTWLCRVLQLNKIKIQAYIQYITEISTVHCCSAMRLNAWYKTASCFDAVNINIYWISAKLLELD